MVVLLESFVLRFYSHFLFIIVLVFHTCIFFPSHPTCHLCISPNIMETLLVLLLAAISLRLCFYTFTMLALVCYFFINLNS